MPSTLQGLLLSRIDQLPAERRRLLQEAAVLGAAFDEALLREVVTDPPAAGALEYLVEAELLQPAGAAREGPRYRFTHALVHEVVYQNLLLARRTELHERVARALERAAGAHPERLSDLEALGHHWSLSADKPRGARYLLAAGDWARGVYANEDAIRHYERALRTLADCDGVRRAGAGRARAAGGSAGAHRAPGGGARPLRGRARGHRGRRRWRGDGAAAPEDRGAALGRRATASGPGPASPRASSGSGRRATRSSARTSSRRWAGSPSAPATMRPPSRGPSAPWPTPRARRRRARTPRGCARPRRCACTPTTRSGVALARTGRPAEAVEQIERSVALAEARDLLQEACRGYTNLGVLYSSLDPPRSIETCLRGLEMAKKVGDLGFQSRLYANLAVAYCALTDRCEAEGIEAANAAIALDRRLGLLDHLAVPLIVLGQIHQCHGDHALAFASYEEALGLAEQVGEPQLLFPCYDGLATLHLDAGDQARAEDFLAKAQAVCERAGLEPDALMVLPFLC